MPKIFEELVLLDENGEVVQPDSKPKKSIKEKRPKERKAKIVIPKTSKKKRGFAAADGKGLDEIREMVANKGYEIFKDKGKKGTGKFIFINGDHDAFVIKHEGRIGLLYDAIYKFGIEKFLKSNTIETSTKENMLENGRVKIARSVLKAIKKENQAEIDRLLEKKMEITLKIMNINLVRRSPEHLALREQLHKIVDELKALDGYEIGNPYVNMTNEELSLAKKRARALKKERKDKKEASKNVKIKGVVR
jgi:hypothetical protein